MIPQKQLRLQGLKSDPVSNIESPLGAPGKRIQLTCNSVSSLDKEHPQDSIAL